MRRDVVAFVVPGDLDSLTGGYGYDRRIIAGLRGAGWHVDLVNLGDAFPAPSTDTLAQAARQLAEIPDGTLVVADGLAFGVLPDLAALHADRLQWAALVHHPLALESGLSETQQKGLADSERRALQFARAVIVTSAATARGLADFGVAPQAIHVVEPGTDRIVPRPANVDRMPPDELSLLCVASLIPRKGHRALIDALSGLQDRPWRLHLAGSTTRDTATADAIRTAISSAGLDGRVRLHGEVDDASLRALYQQADAFVLPSFHEGYGMALAEALAHGLPIVSCAAGAITDTVPHEAGLLLPPGDVAALRAALARVIDEPALRARLAEGARTAGARLPTWAQATARFEAVLQSIPGAENTPADGMRRAPPRDGREGGHAMTPPELQAPAPEPFSADWLTLREPFDHAAREAGATFLALSGLAAQWRRSAAGGPLRVVDLACGHGANLRAVASRLGGLQHWHLVDHDADLLEAVPAALASWAQQHGYRFTAASDGNGRCSIAGPGFQIEVTRQRIDLARNLPSLSLLRTHLVTASALLDLVSTAWLQQLIHQSRDAGAALLFALTVDGRSDWQPADADDAAVHTLFSAHQRRDKGFGPALGSRAIGLVSNLVADAGYDVASVQTDWTIDGWNADTMQRTMIDGIAGAALQQDPSARPLIIGWQARRHAAVGGSRLTVGHVDIVATPR